MNPTPPSKEESKVVLSKKALNRCRSPSAIFLNRKNVKGKCMHCRRYLLQEYQRKETDTEPWVCSFCQEHWFENNETKCYHFCKVCKAFHFAVFFFDPLSQQFEEQCIPSLLNDIKRRKRLHSHESEMMLSEDSVHLLPSRVVSKSMDNR